MAGSGELHKALGVELQEVETPEITVTPAAAEALTAALEGATEALRFGVSANYRYDLQLGAAMFGDVTVEAGGVTFLLDRASAQRAGGTVIDYVKSTMGEGFQITNPNEPAKVQQIRPNPPVVGDERRQQLRHGSRPFKLRHPPPAAATAPLALPAHGDGVPVAC